MQVRDIFNPQTGKGTNLTLVNDPDKVDALLKSLGRFNGRECGCLAYYVLATDGTYHYAYGVRSFNPVSTDQVHVHVEPDSRH